MSAVESTQDRRLGRYHLIASLGQGGMATAHLAAVASPASFNKLFVVKVLRLDASPELERMFLDEARLSARFNHPNVVQAYEAGRADDRYFIALEHLDGQTLRTVKRRLGTALSIADELRVLAETARGLHYVHELADFDGKPLCVVHRDVGPHNVLLTYDGQVKLLDFGIAKAKSAELLTQAGTFKGNIDYVAPEQARGEPIDRRADVFALGALLWEATTGLPFAGGPGVSEVTKLLRRASGGERDVLEARPDVPEALARTIRRAVALDPADRFATALELANEIEGFLEAMSWRPSARSLSEQLSAPFMVDRARIRALVEEQLKRLGESGERDRSLPTLDAGDTTRSLPGVALETSGNALLRPSDTGSGVLAGAPTRGGRVAKLGVASGVLAVAVVLGLRSETPEKAPPIDAGASVVTDAETAVTTAPPTSVVAPTSLVSPSTSVGARPASPGTQDALSTVIIDVHVSPASARVDLDGAMLPKLPFHARLTKDALVHQIEASAPGYETKKLALPFDRDRELRIVLEKERHRVEEDMGRRARAETRREATHAEIVERSPGIDPEPRREPGAPLLSERRSTLRIDKANPYGP